MPKTPPARARRLPKLLVPAVIVLVPLLVLAILPGRLLESLLNQDLEDAIFSKISAERTSLAPLWDSLSVTGVTLVPSDAPDRPLTIGSVTIRDIKRWALIKALLGLGGNIAEVLGEGEVVVRDVSDSGPFGSLKRLKLSSATLRGTSLGLPEGAPIPRNLDYIRISELKLAALDLALPDGRELSADGLSLFDVRDSVVGGAVLSGLRVRQGSDLDLSLGDASLSEVRLVALARAWTAERPIPRLMALLDSFASLDLVSLEISLDGQKSVSLAKGLVDTSAGAEGPAARIWTLHGLRLGLDQLTDPAQGPEARKAFLEALGPEVELDLHVRGAAGGGSSLRVEARELGILDLSVQTKGLSSKTIEGPLLMSLPSASLGDGRLEYLDQGLAAKLLPRLAALDGLPRPALPATDPLTATDPASAISPAPPLDPAAALDPGTGIVPAPAPEAPPSPLSPAAGDLDDPLGDSELVAASRAPALTAPPAPEATSPEVQSAALLAPPAPGTTSPEATSPVVQSAALLTPPAPGKTIPEGQPALAAAPQAPGTTSPEATGPGSQPAATVAPRAPEMTGPEATGPEGRPAAVLLAAFQAWLSGWEDPDRTRSVLNSGILAGELGIFLEDPRSLAIRWEPGEAGFPQNLVDRLGGLGAILAEVARARGAWPSLAAKYKYDIIQCLNMSLEANGRAPVAVYLPPAAPAP